MLRVGIIVIIIATIFQQSYSGTPDPKIRKNLLNNYDPVAHPYLASYEIGTTITVPSLNVIHYDIDDQKQTFELHAWIYMTWTDPRLRWAAYSTQDTTGYLHFTKHEIWRPDVTLYNTAKPKAMDDFADEAQLLVQSNGTIIWVPPIRFLTNCQIFLKHWPFDIQECHLKLGSWTFHENEVDLQFGPGDEKSRVKLLYYEGQQFPNNTEWIITDFTAKRTSKKYSCCPENYVDITYNFKIARKYSSYLYTIIHPVILISFMSILSFLISPNKLPRFIIGMINILIISCYLIYFRKRLPTVDHTPDIVKLFTWNLFVSTISILIGTIILALPNTMENIKITMKTLKGNRSNLLHKNIIIHNAAVNRENNGVDEFSEDEATAGRHDDNKKNITANELAATESQSHTQQQQQQQQQTQPIERKENSDFPSRLIAFMDPIAFSFFTFVTIIMLIYHL